MNNIHLCVLFSHSLFALHFLIRTPNVQTSEPDLYVRNVVFMNPQEVALLSGVMTRVKGGCDSPSEACQGWAVNVNNFFFYHFISLGSGVIVVGKLYHLKT